MYYWGPTRRFFEKIRICPSTLKLGLMGFLDMGNTNIAIKNRMMYSWGSTRRYFEKIQNKKIWKINMWTLNTILGNFLWSYSCSWHLKTPTCPILRYWDKFLFFRKIHAQTLKSTSYDFLWRYSCFLCLKTSLYILSRSKGEFEKFTKSTCRPSGWPRIFFDARFVLNGC